MNWLGIAVRCWLQKPRFAAASAVSGLKVRKAKALKRKSWKNEYK
jgi:hypothetical protein